MTEVIPNFSSAEEILRAAQNYAQRAARACERLSKIAPEARDELYLHHIAKLTMDLASALATYCEDTTTLATDQFAQYTPIHPVPGGPDLERLRELGGSAHAVLQELQAVAKRWGALFRENEERTDADQAREMYAALRELIAGWSRNLSTAFVQMDDM